MIQSMTGFGRCEKVFANKHVVVDVRSLNSRHFDLNLRIPHYLKSKEPAIRKLLTQKMGRGKVDVSFNIDFSGADNTSAINKEIFRAYSAQLKSVCTENDLAQPDILSAVMRMPGVMNSTNELKDDDWGEIESVLNEAVKSFSTYRVNEGEVLADALLGYSNNILKCTEKVSKLAPVRIENIRSRIAKSLEAIKENIEVDKNRFEQELIYFIEKLDLEEEIVRLTSHCNLFNKELTATDGVFKGKKLGFITQEMGREINTIGSKANNVDIQQTVVEMKDELEKLKEQLHNIL